MAENSFVMYKDWEIIVNSLDSDKEVADLFRGIFAYACRGEEMEGTTGALKMAFAIISSQLKRDNEKWEKTVAARIAAGKVGGQAKQANAKGAKQNKQKVTNLPVNVNVNDNVNVNVNESEREEKNRSDFSHPPEKNDIRLYGEYSNVRLTAVQYDKLVEDFGIEKTAEYIQRVDEYIQQSGKKYKDFNLVIRKWISADGAKAKRNRKGENSSFDIAKIEEAMLKRSENALN